MESPPQSVADTSSPCQVSLRAVCQTLSLILLASHAVFLVPASHQLFYRASDTFLCAAVIFNSANVCLSFVLVIGLARGSPTLLKIWLIVFGLQLLAGTVGGVIWVYKCFVEGESSLNVLKKLMVVILIALVLGGTAGLVRRYQLQLQTQEELRGTSSPEDKDNVLARGLEMALKMSNWLHSGRHKPSSEIGQNPSLTPRPYVVAKACQRDAMITCDNDGAVLARPTTSQSTSSSQAQQLREISQQDDQQNPAKVSTKKHRPRASVQALSVINRSISSRRGSHGIAEAHHISPDAFHHQARRGSEPFTCWSSHGEQYSQAGSRSSSRRASLDAVLAMQKFRQATLGGSRAGRRVSAISLSVE